MRHPLLQRGEKLTNRVYVWTLKDHPHRVVGDRRGFEVRLYNDDTWSVPYMACTVDQAAGYVMDLETMPTAAAAEAAAHEMLAALDGASSFMQEH
ncbi:MAG: hypothetical protein AB7O13_16600 [Alphaproteobacteria bacterium]